MNTSMKWATLLMGIISGGCGDRIFRSNQLIDLTVRDALSGEVVPDATVTLALHEPESRRLQEMPADQYLDEWGSGGTTAASGIARISHDIYTICGGLNGLIDCHPYEDAVTGRVYLIRVTKVPSSEMFKVTMTRGTAESGQAFLVIVDFIGEPTEKPFD